MAKICKTCGYANDNKAEVCVECSTPIGGGGGDAGMDLDFDSLLEELQTDEPAAAPGGGQQPAGGDVLDIGVSDDDEASIFAELGIDVDDSAPKPAAAPAADELSLDLGGGGDTDDIFAELGIETGDGGGDIFFRIGY